MDAALASSYIRVASAPTQVKRIRNLRNSTSVAQQAPDNTTAGAAHCIGLLEAHHRMTRALERVTHSSQRALEVSNLIWKEPKLRTKVSVLRSSSIICNCPIFGESFWFHDPGIRSITLKFQEHALKLPTPVSTAFSLEFFFINGSFTRILFT